MKAPITLIAAAAVAGLVSLSAPCVTGAAEPARALETLFPVSGNGAAPGRHFLHNSTIGTKQAVSYFQNDEGLCRLTLMVGDSFDGENVPGMTTVRFEAAVGPGYSARIDTTQGKSLEFACLEGAASMSIRAFEQVVAFSSAM